MILGCGSRSEDLNRAPVSSGSANHSDPGVKSSVASRLGLRVLPAQMEHPELPDFDAQPVIRSEVSDKANGVYLPQPANDVVVEGNQITLNPVLSFVDPVSNRVRDLYFVWTDDSLGDRIVSAFYSSREVDALNRSRIKADRPTVSYDEQHHVWYLSILKVIEKQIFDPSAGDLHYLTLDFLLRNGERPQIYIGFRVIGSMPKIEADFVADPNPPSASDAAERVFKKGLRISERKYKNTSMRPLVLWISTLKEGYVQTQLRSTTYTDDLISPPQARYSYFRSEEKARIELEVMRADQSVEKIAPSLQDAGVYKVKLSALEEINVRWKLAPLPESRICKLNQTSRTIIWAEIRAPEPEIWHSRAVLEGLEVAGLKFAGSLVTQELIADPAVREEEIHKFFKAPGSHLMIASPQRLESDGSALGQLYGSGPLASCQGLYAL